MSVPWPHAAGVAILVLLLLGGCTIRTPHSQAAAPAAPRVAMAR